MEVVMVLVVVVAGSCGFGKSVVLAVLFCVCVSGGWEGRGVG